jgi:hypothetical protein
VTTGLTEDMAEVLAPLRQLAQRLSVAERFLVDKTCDQALELCRDEEQQAEVMVDEFNKLQDEMEDK